MRQSIAKIPHKRIKGALRCTHTHTHARMHAYGERGTEEFEYLFHFED